MKLKLKLKKPKHEESPQYANLDEVIDKTRTFNIIYSGVEQESYFNILYDMGIRNFLMSFHYIQNRHLSMAQFQRDIKFFIDSGAHTYQNDPKYAEYDVEYWESHLQKYLRWAEKYKEHIFAIASFDFENIVGSEVVQRWNEQYFEPFMLRTGIPVCFVWHQNSFNSWEYYCKRYPYVGFSSVNTQGEEISLQEYTMRLRIAENSDAVVHGFGMTRTGMLTKLPFYTADSTTWLVGLQYGEINFWTGQKMTRLKKDKWKGTYLNTICQKFNLDPDLLKKEDVTSMVKANIGAFIEAESYIQNMAKSRFYWQKEKAIVRSESDLSGINFPPIEWILTPRDQRTNVEEYAKELNISTVNLDDANTDIIDMCCFTHWDAPEYQEYIQNTYTEDLLKQIHDYRINRIVATTEERIEDLCGFYLDNLLGKDTTLLYQGTNFDRIVKERDKYVTDEEYETEDIPDMELRNMMSGYLPAPKNPEDPAPEISGLDDEIFSDLGITPVRDENGKFLKGQRSVLKPKKLYSEKYPKLACDRCMNAQSCPEYQPGYVCAYNKMFQRYDTRDIGDVTQAMQGIVDLSMQRLQRAMLTETLNGGIPDPNVSSMMNQSMGLLNQLQRMYLTTNQEIIRQTKVLRADGTQEMTTSVSNPQSGGILAQIFGGMGSSEPEVKQDAPDVVEGEVIDNKTGEN